MTGVFGARVWTTKEHAYVEESDTWVCEGRDTVER